MNDEKNELDSVSQDTSTHSRRDFVRNTGILAAGGVALGAAGMASAPAVAAQEKTATTVALNWKEVYYTNCPLVSASNVDQ